MWYRFCNDCLMFLSSNNDLAALWVCQSNQLVHKLAVLANLLGWPV